jgi:hypothetical protein
LHNYYVSLQESCLQDPLRRQSLYVEDVSYDISLTLSALRVLML